MRQLPRNFARFLDNVALLIVDEPNPAQRAAQGLGQGETLLGLYEGTPQTQRTSSYGMVLPDRITLFRKPIEAAGATEAELVDEIRRTLIHEVAHHCGYEEEQLRD
jgi:predicted Zn-dependent protease with MMP-like domain